MEDTANLDSFEALDALNYDHETFSMLFGESGLFAPALAGAGAGLGLGIGNGAGLIPTGANYNNNDEETKVTKTSKKMQKKKKHEGTTNKDKSDKARRAPSAFILFCNDKRPDIKITHPNAGFVEMGKILGELWSQLSSESKEVYQKMSAQKKAILDVERAEAKAREPAKVVRPPTPYMVFCSQARQQLKTSHPNASFADTGRILGSMWNALDADGKDVYKRMANEQKEAWMLKNKPEGEASQLQTQVEDIVKVEQQNEGGDDDGNDHYYYQQQQQEQQQVHSNGQMYSSSSASSSSSLSIKEEKHQHNYDNSNNIARNHNNSNNNHDHHKYEQQQEHVPESFDAHAVAAAAITNRFNNNDAEAVYAPASASPN